LIESNGWFGLKFEESFGFGRSWGVGLIGRSGSRVMGDCLVVIGITGDVLWDMFAP
jgi:hypothetical protein